MKYKSKRVTRKSRRKPNSKSNAMRAIARSECKKALNQSIETKNFYCRQNLIAVTYNGSVFPMLYDAASLNWLVQGTAKNQYIGDTIRPRGVYINYNCYLNTVTSGLAYNFRVVLLQVKGGGTPSPSNVLQSVGNIMTPWSYFDPNYQETFDVLYSKIHNTEALVNNSVNGKIIIPASRLRPVSFLSGSASSTTSNGIFLLVYTDASAGTTTQFGFQSRFAFKDA